MSMNSAQINSNNEMSESEIDAIDPFLQMLNQGLSIDEICEKMDLPKHPGY